MILIGPESTESSSVSFHFGLRTDNSTAVPETVMTHHPQHISLRLPPPTHGSVEQSLSLHNVSIIDLFLVALGSGWRGDTHACMQTRGRSAKRTEWDGGYQG